MLLQRRGRKRLLLWSRLAKVQFRFNPFSAEPEPLGSVRFRFGPGLDQVQTINCQISQFKYVLLYFNKNIVFLVNKLQAPLPPKSDSMEISMQKILNKRPTTIETVSRHE